MPKHKFIYPSGSSSQMVSKSTNFALAFCTDRRIYRFWLCIITILSISSIYIDQVREA